ncbi:MAG: hypothetical protein ACYC19_05355 [Acidimicrobiales bacterium]
MVFIVLQLTLVPLAVVAGTLAQRRFGHTVGGLIIGLPLASLPMLLLIALQRGTTFATSMSNADLIGSLAEVAVILVYVLAARRLSPTPTLLSALAAFVLGAGVLHFFTFPTAFAGVVSVIAFMAALRAWPARSNEIVEGGRDRLMLRVMLSGGFGLLVLVLAGPIGPGFTGLAAALPVSSLVMAFVTHQSFGADAASRLLEGVARGSFAYVAAIFTFTEALSTGSAWTAFVLSLVVAVIVQSATLLWNTQPALKRALTSPSLWPRVLLEQQPLAFMARH